jgi:hypothetical protein
MYSEYNVRTNNRFLDGDAYRDFNTIEESVIKVLADESDKNGRAEVWQRAVRNGDIFNNPGGEEIPAYDSSLFTNDLNYLANYDYDKASKTLVFLFLKAANIHRDYVLNELLPKYGIHVMDAKVEWSVS